MASKGWNLLIRVCLLTAGLLLAVSFSFLASSLVQTSNPLRSELHVTASVIALFIGFQFSLAAVAIVSRQRRHFSRRVVWTSHAVVGVFLALVAFIYFCPLADSRVPNAI